MAAEAAAPPGTAALCHPRWTSRPRRWTYRQSTGKRVDLTDAEMDLVVSAFLTFRATRALERCVSQACTLRICSWHCSLQ